MQPVKTEIFYREKFWSLVDKSAPNGCWIWTGSPATQGYGRFHHGKRGTTTKAHRFAFELIKGEIPEGLVIDHLCRNRLCVNPDHLEAVTNKENVVVRGINPPAANFRKTHCPRGHSYNKRSPYGRTCTLCQREVRKAAAHRKQPHIKRSPHIAHEVWDRIIELHKQGKTQQAISEVTGVHRRTIGKGLERWKAFGLANRHLIRL